MLRVQVCELGRNAGARQYWHLVKVMTTNSLCLIAARFRDVIEGRPRERDYGTDTVNSPGLTI